MNTIDGGEWPRSAGGICIQREINRLIRFALANGLIKEYDRVYAANQLIGALQADAYLPEEIDEELETAAPILENILTYAVNKGLIKDTPARRDVFDTKIMNCVTPRPSEVVAEFKALYELSPARATDRYYQMSIASDYIRKARVDKNIVWKSPTQYGDLDITINVSKPEKDPRDIEKAKLAPPSSYPKCLLCRENEGFCGTASHPARHTHRIIPIRLGGRQWYFQYSPYIYYNEHCIVLNAEHTPMRITRRTFENLLDFLDLFPHYFIGSNADLPIVGGSILSHDHYQGGRYAFAMEKAPIEETYRIRGFERVAAGRVKWPMSALRLRCGEKKTLIDLAERALCAWRGYSDESVGVLAETGGAPHNTITPIARVNGGEYELDLVLRNNRTTDAHPLGVFHPHAEAHHIKKENIGLIEVMGLAVLPPRLKTELGTIREALAAGREDISNCADVAKHADWYYHLRKKYRKVALSDADEILRREVGAKFLTVLSHAGVFKRDIKGISAFNRFIAAL